MALYPFVVQVRKNKEIIKWLPLTHKVNALKLFDEEVQLALTFAGHAPCKWKIELAAGPQTFLSFLLLRFRNFFYSLYSVSGFGLYVFICHFQHFFRWQAIHFFTLLLYLRRGHIVRINPYQEVPHPVKLLSLFLGHILRYYFPSQSSSPSRLSSCHCFAASHVLYSGCLNLTRTCGGSKCTVGPSTSRNQHSAHRQLWLSKAL